MSTLGFGNVPRIYALADRDALAGSSLVEAVKRMAAGGIRWIQIRAKTAPDRWLAAELDRCCKESDRSGVDLWINDRPDLGRLYPVRGVHLGQGDLPPRVAREVVGKSLWIGWSAHDDGQVEDADADPAVDVVAIGPVFSTTGKRSPEPVVGLDGVHRARSLTAKPLVAIGGIDESNLGSVLAAGADSVAMLGAVCRGEIESNCRRLVELAEESV